MRGLYVGAFGVASVFAPLGAWHGVAAQSVLVAPSAIVIDGRVRTTAVTLVNAGTQPAEVSLSTVFGVPMTDSGGQMRLATFETVHDSMPSAADFIHAYPAQFVLAPGARRVVRLIATPTQPLANREHWARLVVTTRAARSLVTPLLNADGPSDGTTRVGFELEVRSLMAIFYRPAGVTTGVTMAPVHAPVVGADSISMRVSLTREGNAAFVGMLRGVLRDSTGTVRATSQLPLGVYYTLEPRFAIDRTGLPSGTYQLDVEAIGSRPDVPTKLLLPAKLVHQTSRVVLR